MKGLSVFRFIVILVILGAGALPGEAQKGELESFLYLTRVKQINRTQAIRSETSHDSRLERAILRQIPREFADNIRYYYNRVDLNGDSRPEVLVQINGHGVCGSNGCPTFIFRSVGQDYQLVSEIALTGSPVIVTAQKSNGWNDLIMRPGHILDSGYRLMRFNGRTYPASPGDGLTVRQNSTITGRAFLSDVSSGSGIALRIGGSETSTARALNTGRSPSSRQQRATTQSRNPDASLVTAIRNAEGVDSELFAQIEYFFTEVDLNNDGNKEVIVYTASFRCGTHECPVYIFTRSGTGYRLIGTTASESNNGQIAVLSSRSNGWLDIATSVYDAQGRKWKLHRFNGSSYQNTYQNLNSTPSQIVLRPNRGSGISLAQPGIASSQTVTGRSPNSGQQTVRGRSPNERRSATSSNMTARPQVPTWREVIARSDLYEISSDYDLPNEFRNGYVYKVQGPNWIGAYIFKAGLSSYPIPATSELISLSADDAEPYIQSGKAIFLFWNLGNSGLQYANDNRIRFPKTGEGCLRTTCLTAPFMSNAQISSILRSERPISETSVATSNTQRSPNSGQQTAAGRSLLVAANTQSIRGVTVPPAEKSPSRLPDGYGFFLDKPNAKKLDDGTLIYSFDVYNMGYADGVVEVYDARNNLIEVRGIEGFRNPATNLYAFPVEGVNRLFRLATEGYGLFDLRNAFGRAKKTEIRNIAIPRGGRLIFTKNSERAIIYNQATFVMGVLADSVLSKFPSGNDATLKANILSSLFIEIQKERVGSLLRDGMFLTAQDSRRAFANQSWIEEQNLSKLMEIGSKVLAQELLKYGAERTVVDELVLGKKLSFWVTAAESTVKGSNAFLQWLDWERSRKWEQADGQPFGISN
ncbi:MAG TPA: hypothetical protein DDW76_10205 [Cyanobacteria bacterium UBA11369]|nr:hypothetical protein [Cyanobacteria bacterium UBA11371]HBE19408.1 hypothetical protein [Cyanobacteria bacterium UBA11367]HBE34649.1 hypothetical protein [Cyanobacteria bacterium UBA11368]HBE49146.1 hypothetical protein [Cyanobacteria bacterium UBA11369]